MPAIDLVRLRQQALQLREQFADPKAFLHDLNVLLESYALHGYRRGETQHSALTLPTYRAPAPVLKQVHFELQGAAQRQPKEALALADALWGQRSLEHRMLAARLLGSIPAAPPAPILERLGDWVENNREESLLRELALNGSAALREEQPGDLIAFCQKCLKSDEVRRQSLALLALTALVTQTNFANLPTLFESIEPLASDPPKRPRPYLAGLLEALAARSPRECQHFLEALLTEHAGEGTRWVARQALKFLPAEGQESLRGLLQPKEF